LIVGSEKPATNRQETKMAETSGPIGVEGAEPGDLLVVDILDIGVLPESDWGFSGIFASESP
jgi:formamidase